MVDEVRPAEVEAFLSEVGSELGVKMEVSEFGVSRILRCIVEGRSLSIGTGGSDYWVSADVLWPTFPRVTGICWAPEESYIRAKLLEDGTSPPSTGDAAFDGTYLLLGDGATELSHNLTAEVRRAFLEHESIHPGVKWLDMTLMHEHLHVEARPPVRSGNDRWPRLGEGQFTAKLAAGSLLRAASLASKIEEVA
jgi:hypothetical protein